MRNRAAGAVGQRYGVTLSAFYIRMLQVELAYRDGDRAAAERYFPDVRGLENTLRLRIEYLAAAASLAALRRDWPGVAVSTAVAGELARRHRRSVLGWVRQRLEELSLQAADHLDRGEFDRTPRRAAAILAQESPDALVADVLAELAPDHPNQSH